LFFMSVSVRHRWKTRDPGACRCSMERNDRQTSTLTLAANRVFD